MPTPKPRADASRQAPPATLFLFGAHGDLAQRLLVPALYSLWHHGLVGSNLKIVGIDHNQSDDDAFRTRLGDTLRRQVADPDAEACGAPLDDASWRSMTENIHYIVGDFLEDDTYTQVRQYLQGRPTGNAIFYLAVSPGFFGEIAQRLAHAGLLDETNDTFRRVVVEKPFGTDLDSARELNAVLLGCANESQIYRIDHFLGKETVQNILISRFSNTFFEAVWNNHYIDHVQISAAETLGVGERGRFYEPTGALRDMVPNHLFQLLALIAMEPPAAFGADAVRSEKAKVIGAIRPLSHDEALANSVRGQYEAGSCACEDVAGYREEPNVSPDSHTETYVALKLMIDNWRWAGVPFYLRTGKRLRTRSTEIVIRFKPAPYALFRGTPIRDLQPNELIIRIQPNEGMWLDFNAKRPGQSVDIERVQMGFAYADFFELQSCTGYETLVYDCLIGDQTLFQRADNIENGWQAVQPFLDAWKTQGPPEPYAAGGSGPAGADALLARDNRAWQPLENTKPANSRKSANLARKTR